MRAINHAMTGALIGLTINEPVMALPLAVVSHFALDAIPHHDSAKPNEEFLRSKSFAITLIIDACLCVSLVLLLAAKRPQNWLLAAVCAFLATSPDLLYVNRFVKARQHKKLRLSRFVQWTRDIQWFARPIGAVVEVAWFIGASLLLLTFF